MVGIIIGRIFSCSVQRQYQSCFNRLAKKTLGPVPQTTVSRVSSVPGSGRHCLSASLWSQHFGVRSNNWIPICQQNTRVLSHSANLRTERRGPSARSEYYKSVWPSHNLSNGKTLKIMSVAHRPAMIISLRGLTSPLKHSAKVASEGISKQTITHPSRTGCTKHSNKSLFRLLFGSGAGGAVYWKIGNDSVGIPERLLRKFQLSWKQPWAKLPLNANSIVHIASNYTTVSDKGRFKLQLCVTSQWNIDIKRLKRRRANF